MAINNGTLIDTGGTPLTLTTSFQDIGGEFDVLSASSKVRFFLEVDVNNSIGLEFRLLITRLENNNFHVLQKNIVKRNHTELVDEIKRVNITTDKFLEILFDTDNTARTAKIQARVNVVGGTAGQIDTAFYRIN